MRVFLCEKPSQARDIAGVMGRVVRRDGFLEAGGDLVTWCIGHLYEQLKPEEYDPALRSWSMAALPIIPDEWRLAPTARGRKQIGVIRKLLGRTDSVVIATDPDREGEVIAREVLDELDFRGRLYRLLLNALDPASVRKGLDAIRDGAGTESLYHAGMGRTRADWLVGMNLTRAHTLLGRSRGESGLRSVGRVQTPTLALIVRRDREIADFLPRDYHVVEADCSHPQHAPFRAVWLPDAAQRESICDDEGRCINRDAARRLAQALTGQDGVVSQSKQERKTVKPPLAFSLSSLQQLASKRFGLGAKDTLTVCQALYETHKAVTYPRTDCEYLPESQFAEAPQVLDALAQTFSGTPLKEAVASADPAIRSRVWNDRKVTAHHGMIPVTGRVETGRMNDRERAVHELIVVRYLMQFLPDHLYDATTLDIGAGGCTLRAAGRRVVQPGWRALETADPETDEEHAPVPALARGESVRIDVARVVDRKTRAPAHYTEGTLIRAMTNIASVVDDPETRKILKEQDGIGTEATRGDIIQTLKDRQYIEAGKKSLRATSAGRALIDEVAPELADPVLTAMMERALSRVADGSMTLAAFMRRMEEVVATLVRAAAAQAQAMPTGAGSAAGKAAAGPAKACPQCGKPMQRRQGKYGAFLGCTGYPACRHVEKPGKPGQGAQPVRTDKACPECGKPLLKRKGKKGFFLGCSGFPECRHTAEAK